MDKPRHPNVIRIWVPSPRARVPGPAKAVPAPRQTSLGAAGALRAAPHPAPAHPGPAAHP